MARLCSDLDWTTTALGAPESWSERLKTAARLVLDSSLPMTLAWGEELVQIYNDGYLEILGSKHPDALGQPVEQVYSEIWEDIRPLIERVKETGEPVWQENRYLPIERQGFQEELYFTFSYSPVCDANGHPVGILSAAFNTTPSVLAQRRLEILRKLGRPARHDSVSEVLRASLSHLGENTADLPVCLLYEFRPLNRSFELLDSTGADPETIPDNEAFTEALLPDLLNADIEPVSLPTSLLKHVVVADDGRPSVGDVVGVPLWDDDGNTRRCVGCLVVGLSSQLVFETSYREFIADIGVSLSESVRHVRYQQMQLAYAERRYEAVFENSMDAKMLTAPDGRIIEANPAASALLGYTQEEFRELGRSGLVDLNDERLPAAVESRAQTGSFRGELDFVHKDGHLIPCEVSSRIYHDVDGNERTSMVLRDQRARLEMEAKLRQAQKLDVVGKLAGVVAHDFNNLLTAIDASAQFLQETVEPGTDAEEDVAVIRAASERASALTRRILSFSRQKPVQTSYLDLAQVVGDLDAVLRSLLRENIEVVAQIQESPRSVYASRLGIEQVLLNLVVNARDAMKEGGTLTVELSDTDIDQARDCTRGELHAGSWVRIVVTDTGCGLPDTDYAQLFEPFFTTKEHGTGLGLATVAQVVEDCDGAICVESEAGKGTCFEIYLPTVESSTRVDQLDEDSTSMHPSWSGRVLLIEDHPLVRKVTAKMLSEAGFEVTTASSGSDAIQTVKESGPGTFRLVISDVVMPNMSGEETLRRLKELDPGLKFLFVTGYADNLSLNLASSVRADVLLKPFTKRQLLAHIEKALLES